MSKTILIVILALAVFGIGGGSYYYFEIYQPQQYAESLLSFYQRLQSIGLEPDTSSLKDATDYEAALGVLEARIPILESLKSELSGIKTPGRMANFHNEFSSYLDFALAQHKQAARLGVFIKNANTVLEAVTALKNQDSPQINEENATVGDFQRVLGERFSKIQNSAEALFRDEVTESTQPSFSELKSIWEGASPGIDLFSKKLNALNPRLPVSQIGNLFTPLETQKFQGYTKKLEEFLKAIENLVKQYSAYDLLAFRHFPDATPQESSERALNFYQTIQKLKEQYGK